MFMPVSLLVTMKNMKLRNTVMNKFNKTNLLESWFQKPPKEVLQECVHRTQGKMQ